MEIVYWFAGAVALTLVLGYFRVPLIGWTLAAGAMLWLLGVIAGLGLTGNLILWTAFAAVALALNVPALRRALITNRVLGIYRRILPDMSQTEKEAIDAGTVWWDADLFSGRPDWNKLLATPAPKLTAEEQAFVDGPVEELCTMVDEWQINHVHADLPRIAVATGHFRRPVQWPPKLATTMTTPSIEHTWPTCSNAFCTERRLAMP